LAAVGSPTIDDLDGNDSSGEDLNLSGSSKLLGMAVVAAADNSGDVTVASDAAANAPNAELAAGGAVFLSQPNASAIGSVALTLTFAAIGDVAEVYLIYDRA